MPRPHRELRALLTPRRIASVSLPLRRRVVARYVGELCASLAVMVVVPGLVALALGEVGIGSRFLAMGALLLALWRASRVLPGVASLQTNEGLAVVAVTFVLASAVSTWPLAAAGIPVPDAAFEAVSAVTTTGLSTLASVEALPAGFVFARSWLQWYGGLLIVVLALALLLGPGPVARRLAGDLEPSDLIGSTRVRARRSALIYLGFSAIGWLLLRASGVDGFDAAIHVMSAVSTGGFSSHDTSIAGLENLAAAWILAALSLAGAVSFALHHQLVRGDWRTAWRDGGWSTLLGACVAVTVLVGVVLTVVDGLPWRQALQQAPLLAISAQTTTGFEITPTATLSPAVQLLLVGAMVMGGQAGSTAGGIKTFRITILARLAFLQALRPTLAPHAVPTWAVARHRASAADAEGAVGIAVLFAIGVALGWLAFLAHGHAPMAALFDVTSAICTVGMAGGTVGPDLAPALKAVLAALMLLGRLEVVALLVLVYPGSWMRRREEGP